MIEGGKPRGRVEIDIGRGSSRRAVADAGRTGGEKGGRVLSVDAEKIRVEIISSSACTSCHAAGLCSMSEAVKKIVDVPVFGNSGYAPGDEVELVLTASMGMKAVSACMMPSPRSSENHS